MPLQLVTGYMRYRENSSDSWHPVVVHTTPESGTLSYTTAQSLTAVQKQTVWLNMDVNAAVEKNALILTTPTFSSLPKTYSHPDITANHVVVQIVVANPQVQADDWHVITGNGEVRIEGTIATGGQTNVQLVLVKALAGNAT